MESTKGEEERELQTKHATEYCQMVECSVLNCGFKISWFALPCSSQFVTHFSNWDTDGGGCML